VYGGAGDQALAEVPLIRNPTIAIAMAPHDGPRQRLDHCRFGRSRLIHANAAIE
jgi:hypothetical protein